MTHRLSEGDYMNRCSHNVTQQVIAEVVNEVFDKYKGASMNISTLVALVLDQFPKPQPLTVLAGRIIDYVQQRPKEYQIVYYGSLDNNICRIKDRAISVVQAKAQHCACKFCKTDLLVGENPCWKCGTNN